MAGNDMTIDPQLSARVRAQLLANPDFQAWQKSAGNAVRDPGRFGITGLPKNAWIDKQGNVQTTDESFPWKPFLETVGVGATAGTAGALLAGGAAAAPAVGALGPSTAGNIAATTAAASAASAVPPALATGASMSTLWSPATLKLIELGINTGTGLYGLHQQTASNDRAAEIQAQSQADALAFLKDQDAKDRAQYDTERQHTLEIEGADRAIAGQRRGNIANVAAGENGTAYGSLLNLLGIHAPSQAPLGASGGALAAPMTGTTLDPASARGSLARGSVRPMDTTPTDPTTEPVRARTLAELASKMPAPSGVAPLMPPPTSYVPVTPPPRRMRRTGTLADYATA